MFEFSSLSLQKYLHDSSKKFSVMMKTFWKQIDYFFLISQNLFEIKIYSRNFGVL